MCVHRSKRVAVAADVTAGELAGVQGTPSFFVNGIFLGGQCRTSN